MDREFLRSFFNLTLINTLFLNFYLNNMQLQIVKNVLMMNRKGFWSFYESNQAISNTN